MSIIPRSRKPQFFDVPSNGPRWWRPFQFLYWNVWDNGIWIPIGCVVLTVGSVVLFATGRL